jgi:RNase adapter protein RapZ
MQFVIITGISGSGKSLALRIFEDMGFYCVDNMPPALIPQLAALCDGSGVQALGHSVVQEESSDRTIGPTSPPPNTEHRTPNTEHPTSTPCSACGDGRIACVTDVRAGGHLVELQPALRELEQRGVTPLLLFLDASDSVLVNRFKETRRKHPLLVPSGGILGSIAAEREMLKELKERADKIIDTSDYNPRALTGTLSELFGKNGGHEGTMINITSFGFKHGLPLDADLVFDVRFLANPHYVRELRWQDGRDEAVSNYVKQDPLTQPFLEKLFDLVGFTLPQYVAEGKAYLTIAIGCTGGRHRSVMVAEELAAFLREKGYHPLVQHRDAKK